jgi:hypothetical protein
MAPQIGILWQEIGVLCDQGNVVKSKALMVKLFHESIDAGIYAHFYPPAKATNGPLPKNFYSHPATWSIRKAENCSARMVFLLTHFRTADGEASMSREQKSA